MWGQVQLPYPCQPNPTSFENLDAQAYCSSDIYEIPWRNGPSVWIDPCESRRINMDLTNWPIGSFPSCWNGVVQEVEENNLLRAIHRNHCSQRTGREWVSVESNACWTYQSSIRINTRSVDIIGIGGVDAPAVGFIINSSNTGTG